MKIGLIGHGAMGKPIKNIAEEKNHEIAASIDESDTNN